MTTPEDETGFFDHAHDQLDRWTIRVVYTMKTSDVYLSEDRHSHIEPRYGDVRVVLDEAVEERDLAKGRNTLLTIRSHHGFPIALDPGSVASIRIEVVGPGGEQILPIKPGWMSAPDGDGDDEPEGVQQ